MKRKKIFSDGRDFPARGAVWRAAERRMVFFRHFPASPLARHEARHYHIEIPLLHPIKIFFRGVCGRDVVQHVEGLRF